MSTEAVWTLRVAGLGHNVILKIKASSDDSPTTVGELKSEIGRQISLPSEYQRLLARGKPMDNNDAPIHEYGIQGRTRIMLLHSAEFAEDREPFIALEAIVQEIKKLEESAKTDESMKTPKLLHELVTQLCCKLDGVDVRDSVTLRTMRKNALKRAEAIEVEASQNR